MKAQYLKQLLNNTGYNVHAEGRNICIGSPMCSNLISVNVDEMKIRYALDTFNNGWVECLSSGRKNSSTQGIQDICTKLEELIGTGELIEIFNGKDELENPVKVYTCENGELIEHNATGFGWPNTTENGELIYDNTHFNTAKDALLGAIEESKSNMKFLTIREKELQRELEEIGAEIQTIQNNLLRYKEQL